MRTRRTFTKTLAAVSRSTSISNEKHPRPDPGSPGRGFGVIGNQKTKNHKNNHTMKQTINQYQFVYLFLQFRPENFSRDALAALYEYYRDFEEDTGEEIEFDPVSICCDWTEYDSASEAAEACGWECEDAGDEKNDTSEREALQYLHDEAIVLKLSSGFVVLNS